MIYLKEPITNRIVPFQNQSSIGAGFIGWATLTESEILAYELQEAKTSKLAELLENRKVFQYKNIDLGGVTYIATQTACANLDGAISVLTDNNLTECNWLDANGNSITLTLIEAKSLRTAMFMQQSNAYLQESSKKIQIDACSTIEELNAIDITIS